VSPAPVVRLGDVFCEASSPQMWTLRSGVQPVTQAFDMSREDADRLLGTAGAGGGPITGGSGGNTVTLRIESSSEDGGKQGEFQRLHVIHRAPGKNPHEARVVVADGRYFLPYKHILRRYNVRRTTGVKRVVNQATPELQPVVGQIEYAPWSLTQDVDSGSSRWSALEVLQDILSEALGIIPGGANFFIFGRVGTLDVPIENIEFDDTADNAIARIMGYLPAAMLYVDPTGRFVVDFKSSGEERGVLQALGPAHVDGGHDEFVTMDRVRPALVHVGFHRKIEVRFDAEELVTTRERNGRFMDNVLEVPDFTLDVPNVGTVCMGTWITVEQALEAWGVNANLGRALTLADVRAMLVPFNDMMAGLSEVGAAPSGADWPARIAALSRHFRRTYRLNRRWVDRAFRIEACRVAVIDPVGGTRAPALAFCDRYHLGTQRSLFTARTAGQSLAYSVSILGWPSGGTINSSTRAAATVSVIDADQGIIDLDFASDPLRQFDVAYPSQIELEGDNTQPGTQSPHPGPTSAIDDTSVSPTFDGCYDDDQRFYTLTARHKVAVILTLTPAAPNNAGQLTWITKRPPGARGTAQGPEMEVVVGSGVEMARVAWQDGKADLIERAFGISDGSLRVDLSELTVNQRSDDFGASLDAIAEAVARKVYADFSDRVQGGRTSDFNPALVPVGWLDEVIHTVGQDGRVETQIAFPGRGPTLVMTTFLPESTRKILFRLGDPGRKS
jgi:hypothetical protein